LNSSAASRFAAFPLASPDTADVTDISEKRVSAPDLSDELLLSRIAANDKEALTFLFRRHASLVLGIAQRMLRDSGEAEDLVQEVFLYLYRNAGVFDSAKSSGRSWIVQIVYYHAIARRRYLSTRHSHDRLGQQGRCIEIPAATTDRQNHSEEAFYSSALVSEVWQSLTNSQRETLHLYFFEGYSLSEIGVKLGQPAGNIRHHYYRGLDRLRARLCAK